MSWKTQLQLIDLASGQRLEVTCVRCGHSRYETVQSLAAKQGMAYDYLDEVERNLICHNRGCAGPVRIALPPESETEGFQGGLA